MTDTQRPVVPLLAGLTVLATMIVVAILGYRWAINPLFGYDESAHTLQAHILPKWKALFEFSADAHPMLYFLLLRPIALLSKDPLYLRLLSLVPSLLTLPVVYLLLRRLRVHTGVALITVIVLASAWSFLSLGITIRAYALATFFEVAGLWLWLDLLPGTDRSPPRRWSVVGALALFTAAFWCNYSAGFVTAAIFGGTVLTMAPRKTTRELLIERLRRYSGWPEWSAFFGFHLLTILWFKIGWISHVKLGTPIYLQPFSRLPDQGVGEFLAGSMRNELSLFTPLEGLGDRVLDAGALVLLATIATLTVVYLRRGNIARAVVVLTPLFVLGILALLSTLGKYPFGGELRHQYVVFPYLLLLLPLALDLVWTRLGHPIVRVGATALIIGISVSTTLKTLKLHVTPSEAPISAYWKTEWDHLFAKGSDAPLFVSGFPFRTGWINRLEAGVSYRDSYARNRHGIHGSYQGWQAILLPWPLYQEYDVRTDDGGESSMIHSYVMMFDAVPDDQFMTDVRGILRITGRNSGRVFAAEAGIDIEADEPRLRAAAACNGFIVHSVEKVDNSLLWAFDLEPEPDAASREACHAGLQAEAPADAGAAQ